MFSFSLDLELIGKIWRNESDSVLHINGVNQEPLRVPELFWNNVRGAFAKNISTSSLILSDIKTDEAEEFKKILVAQNKIRRLELRGTDSVVTKILMSSFASAQNKITLLSVSGLSAESIDAVVPQLQHPQSPIKQLFAVNLTLPAMKKLVPALAKSNIDQLTLSETNKDATEEIASFLNSQNKITLTVHKLGPEAMNALLPVVEKSLTTLGMRELSEVATEKVLPGFYYHFTKLRHLELTAMNVGSTAKIASALLHPQCQIDTLTIKNMTVDPTKKLYPVFKNSSSPITHLIIQQIQKPTLTQLVPILQNSQCKIHTLSVSNIKVDGAMELSPLFNNSNLKNLRLCSLLSEEVLDKFYNKLKNSPNRPKVSCEKNISKIWAEKFETLNSSMNSVSAESLQESFQVATAYSNIQPPVIETPKSQISIQSVTTSETETKKNSRFKDGTEMQDGQIIQNSQNTPLSQTVTTDVPSSQAKMAISSLLTSPNNSLSNNSSSGFFPEIVLAMSGNKHTLAPEQNPNPQKRQNTSSSKFFTNLNSNNNNFAEGSSNVNLNDDVVIIDVSTNQTNRTYTDASSPSAAIQEKNQQEHQKQTSSFTYSHFAPGES